jgi:hypothetical protein
VVAVTTFQRSLKEKRNQYHKGKQIHHQPVPRSAIDKNPNDSSLPLIKLIKSKRLHEIAFFLLTCKIVKRL